MKKLLLQTAIMFTLSLCACSSKPATSEPATAKPTNEDKTAQSAPVANNVNVSTEALKPLDLTGLWVQEDPNDSYMAAVIRQDGMIGVFFILKDDETPWTYWVGTYEAPTDNAEKYSWTSQNTYGGVGLLSSDAETKDFSYNNGKITYEVTIQGTTKKVSLIKGEWDTSIIPDDAFGSVNLSQEKVSSIEIKESSWLVTDGGYLYYYVKIYNPRASLDLLKQLKFYSSDQTFFRCLHTIQCFCFR